LKVEIEVEKGRNTNELKYFIAVYEKAVQNSFYLHK